MDPAFLASLMLHPSRRALLALDAQGTVLSANDRARELVTPELERQLRVALAEGMLQLARHPGRQVHHTHEGGGLRLDCVLRAVHRDGDAGPLLGYTASIFSLDEDPELAESPDRARWRFGEGGHAR